MFFQKLLLSCIFFFSFSVSTFASDPSSLHLTPFKKNSAWQLVTTANAIANRLQITTPPAVEKNIFASINNQNNSQHLVSEHEFGDSLLTMDYLVTEGAAAYVFLQGRYAIVLKNNNNEWQTLSVKFRAPRFNEASQKIQPALFLEVRINGELITQNEIIHNNSENSFTPWESDFAPTTILVKQGALALRNVSISPADFSQIVPPVNSGAATNAAELIDYVALGKETFESVGCSVCHTVTRDTSAVSTGPNLFGLFKVEARTREIIEGGEGHHFTIKANIDYLRRSVRAPSEQIAIAEKGVKKGEAYPALMPVFNTETVSDIQLNAIAAYLTTLNELQDQGAAIKLVKQTGIAPYNPLDDTLQLLVNDQVRIQRGPLAGDIASGVSGRAIHVGLVNSVNYSFDPRLLAITKMWQGGFLDMTGEFTNRGGKGLKLGYESREINLGKQHFLFAPLNSEAKLIDFSFKDAIFGDNDTVKKSLYSQQDHLNQLATIDAQFLGYTRSSLLTKKDKQQAPYFRYRVGNNILAVQTNINTKGEVNIHISGELKTSQLFSINTHVLTNANISEGQFQNAIWTLPAGKINAHLNAKITLTTNAWHVPVSNYNNRKQPLIRSNAIANLPAGYRIENYYPPKDNFGREQLFEALGLASTADGTLVVATRTAGIWRLVKGQWQLFAEGTFDSLGVLVEDQKGLSIVVGQKAELTRISDTNGDGVADDYETLFDAHSYHGNYHSYMHGPVRGSDGAYYININLADGSDGSAYNAGGKYMGSSGGFSGWNIRVDASQPHNIGTFTPWANGLRSPAGMALSPDNRLWYSENQGEYVGTSKLFSIEKNHFYGHPASLIDLPNMTPNSPEISWSNVASERAMPAILFPHNRVANSPSNPAWDTTQGKFGAFAGQMVIGDQAQSNLLRVSLQKVDGVDQGSVMPFMDGLESGVMRPLFLADGSLLLGQTGRGWQAKGGHVASLQHIVWDGKTIAPAIKKMDATAQGFTVEFTQPLPLELDDTATKNLLTMESWVYRDAADYGSDELGLQQDSINSVSISNDRRNVRIQLATLTQPVIHPQQTARVYHLHINGHKLFNTTAMEQMDTYYTLYKFPNP